MTPATTSSPRHLIRLADLTPGDLDRILEEAQRTKRTPGRGELAGRTVGLLFFRGSLRTRISFEVAVHQAGGHTINLTATSDFWDLEDRENSVMDGRAPEHIKDAAAVLSRYVDALAVRPAPAGKTWDVDRRDAQIHSWARYARVPVINMESSLWHPLQALADRMTLHETLGDPRGKRIALTWVNAPEPATSSVCHSLLDIALRDGMNVSIAHPPGFDLDPEVVRGAEALAAENGCELRAGLSLEEAVEGANVVYARSWQSLQTYGNPTLAASRRSRLTDWRIDERLLALGDDCRVMHAMPIRRNIEVTDDVLDGRRSLVYDQAENRLHTEKALLTNLLT